MGSEADRKIREWQDRAGLKLPSPEICEEWRRLQQLCFKTIRIAELEVSGIRDGHGGWSGGDVVGGTWNDLRDAADRLEAAYRGRATRLRAVDMPWHEDEPTF